MSLAASRDLRDCRESKGSREHREEPLDKVYPAVDSLALQVVEDMLVLVVEEVVEGAEEAINLIGCDSCLNPPLPSAYRTCRTLKRTCARV